MDKIEMMMIGRLMMIGERGLFLCDVVLVMAWYMKRWMMN
jgi:hypothetical protein